MIIFLYCLLPAPGVSFLISSSLVLRYILNGDKKVFVIAPDKRDGPILLRDMELTIFLICHLSSILNSFLDMLRFLDAFGRVDRVVRLEIVEN